MARDDEIDAGELPPDAAERAEGAAADAVHGEARDGAGEDGFLDDVTQLYLNEIGATLACARRSA